jgi:hypothetical protein
MFVFDEYIVLLKIMLIRTYNSTDDARKCFFHKVWFVYYGF